MEQTLTVHSGTVSQGSLTVLSSKELAYYSVALRSIVIIFNMDVCGLCGYVHVNVHIPARDVEFPLELELGAWNSSSP